MINSINRVGDPQGISKTYLCTVDPWKPYRSKVVNQAAEYRIIKQY
jgi:hypothetical protein